MYSAVWNNQTQQWNAQTGTVLTDINQDHVGREDQWYYVDAEPVPQPLHFTATGEVGNAPHADSGLNNPDSHDFQDRFVFLLNSDMNVDIHATLTRLDTSVIHDTGSFSNNPLFDLNLSRFYMPINGNEPWKEYSLTGDTIEPKEWTAQVNGINEDTSGMSPENVWNAYSLDVSLLFDSTTPEEVLASNQLNYNLDIWFTYTGSEWPL